MKDFYNNNKKLCLIIAALLLFALCRMAIYDRRYYVSKNRYVVINRVTGSCAWCNAEYKTRRNIIEWFEDKLSSKECKKTEYKNLPDIEDFDAVKYAIEGKY